jgi:hypothetical protein
MAGLFFGCLDGCSEANDWPFQGVYGGVWSLGNIAWTKNVRAKTWLRSKPILEVAMVCGPR